MYWCGERLETQPFFSLTTAVKLTNTRWSAILFPLHSVLRLLAVFFYVLRFNVMGLCLLSVVVVKTSVVLSVVYAFLGQRSKAVSLLFFYYVWTVPPSLSWLRETSNP